MTYKISDANIKTLKKLPETGMGYHLIEATVNYVQSDYIIVNGQIAFEKESGIDEKVKLYFPANNNIAFTELPTVNLTDIHLKKSALNIVNEPNSNVKDAAFENANGDELFVRLSAFEDDIRVDKKDGCLLPVSFTTTASDALKCKVEKDDPIDRYALPNELAIKWSFYIQPNKTDRLQRGNVEANYGKKGGGREVYFEKGTRRGTFITQMKW